MRNYPNISSYDPAMSIKELAELGVSEIAYIRYIHSQEIIEKFPMVEGLQPGVTLWALFSANGDPLALADNHDGILSNAYDLNLHTVSLH